MATSKVGTRRRKNKDEDFLSLFFFLFFFLFFLFSFIEKFFLHIAPLKKNHVLGPTPSALSSICITQNVMPNFFAFVANKSKAVSSLMTLALLVFFCRIVGQFLVTILFQTAVNYAVLFYSGMRSVAASGSVRERHEAQRLPQVLCVSACAAGPAGLHLQL